MASGIPSLMMGSNLEDIASGIDELMIRQPVGVVGVIAPFNFPGMIPLWFLPYAVACGNTLVLKPSEKTPMTMAKIFQLAEQAGFPPGVLNLVHGGKDAVDALLDHPVVRAISFVGSTSVARYIYSRAAANGKRVQCQGGAKNPVVVLPDADLDMTTKIVADSAFGCAGQRCLASSVVITVADATKVFTAADQRCGRRAQGRLRPRGRRRDGAGDLAREPRPHRGADRRGRRRRRQADRRRPQREGRRLRERQLRAPDGAGRRRSGERARAHRSLRPGAQPDAAPRRWTTRSRSSTRPPTATRRASSRAAARRRASSATKPQVGNIGINVGVAAPMAYFPFSGWKESFFGDLHAQGRDAIDFYTEKKIVVERWPATWSRKF